MQFVVAFFATSCVFVFFGFCSGCNFSQKIFGLLFLFFIFQFSFCCFVVFPIQFPLPIQFLIFSNFSFFCFLFLFSFCCFVVFLIFQFSFLNFQFFVFLFYFFVFVFSFFRFSNSVSISNSAFKFLQFFVFLFFRFVFILLFCCFSNSVFAFSFSNSVFYIVRFSGFYFPFRLSQFFFAFSKRAARFHLSVVFLFLVGRKKAVVSHRFRSLF